MRKPVNPLFPLLSVILFATLGYSILLTVLNIFLLSDDRNLTLDIISLGVLMSFYPLGQFVGAPFLVAFSQKWGIKKIILFSLALSTLFFLLIALSFHFFLIFSLFPLLFLAGMSEGNIVLAQNELLHRSLKQHDTHHFNHIYTVIAFGLIFGPLISAELIKYSLATPFWILACIFFSLIFLVGYFQKKDPPFEEYHHPKVAFKKSFTFFKIFKTPLRKFYIALSLLYLGIFLFIRSYPIIVIELFGFNINLLDELISFLSIILILSGVLVIKPLSQKVPSAKLTTLFSFLLGLSYLLMFFPSTITSLWILLALITFLLSIVLTAASALIYDTPHEGNTLANNLLLLFLSEALACLLGSLLILLYPFLPLFISALFSFTAGLILLRHKPT